MAERIKQTPWKVSKVERRENGYLQGYDHLILSRSGFVVAKIDHVYAYDEATQDAHADLLAAAPDLLAALREVEPIITAMADSGSIDLDHANMVRAAIAKAGA